MKDITGNLSRAESCQESHGKILINILYEIPAFHSDIIGVTAGMTGKKQFIRFVFSYGAQSNMIN